MSEMVLRPSHTIPQAVGAVAQHLGLVVHGLADREVSGASVSSSAVVPGDLFGAFPGFKVHGARFVGEALARGAAAVLTDDAGLALVREVSADVPVLVSPQPRRDLGGAASLLYGEPSRDLRIVAVTGTNGKTTTTYLVEAALARAHPRTGMLGTVELRIGDETMESPRTTVEAPVLHSALARMVELGVSACVVEVSSHAAALDRIAGLEADVAVFTNLQWDHLDFHGTMERYLEDKARLFAPERARRGVICVDDEWGQRLAAAAAIPIDTVATAPGSSHGQWNVDDADIGLDGVGSRFTLVAPDGTRHEAHSPLPGLVNVSNAALAVVAAHRAGVDLAEAIAGVGSARAIPGRMERVIERSEIDPLAIVDYAHTPDALTLALAAVRPITPGKVILIFGSDGDRDQGKRPVMGQIGARGADVVVLTDENPRSEDPATIRSAIRAGIQEVRPDLHDVHEVEPRSAAVEYGLRLGGPDDTVIVTGKGHEPTQEIAGVFHRYNDRNAYLEAYQSIQRDRQEQG